MSDFEEKTGDKMIELQLTKKSLYYEGIIY